MYFGLGKIGVEIYNRIHSVYLDVFSGANI